jgi:hypothetical protein
MRKLSMLKTETQRLGAPPAADCKRAGEAVTQDTVFVGKL